MFDIGWSELLVIDIVALVVIGPKELPGVVRAVAQNLGKLRRMASDFQSQFTDAMREMELAELKKDAEKLLTDATSGTSLDEVKKVSDEIKKTVEEPLSIAEPPKAEPAKPADAVDKPKSEQDRGA